MEPGEKINKIFFDQLKLIQQIFELLQNGTPVHILTCRFAIKK